MKETEKSAKIKLNVIMKRTKKGYKKWLAIDSENYLKKQKINTECPKKINKNQENMRKIKFVVCPKKKCNND